MSKYELATIVANKCEIEQLLNPELWHSITKAEYSSDCLNQEVAVYGFKS